MANLDKSPLELGMSRADLWAFAGVLALGMHLNVFHENKVIQFFNLR